MHIPKFLTALCLGAALSLSGPAVLAKDKKASNDKEGSRKVVKRDAGPSAQSSVVRTSSSPRVKHGVANVRQSSPNKGSDFASLRRSHTSERRIVPSASGRRADRKAAIAPSTQFASRATGDTRDRTIRSDSDVARTRTRDDTVQSSSPALRHSRPDNRDRSDYSRRHEHHSPDWYSRNGWWYDRDYWHTHHAHRYYNDLLGVYIIDVNGPGYAYGPNYDGYSDYYNFDYETRLAVQEALAEAGYYNGPVDGVIGPGTQSAIASYQDDYGLPVTGRIDNPLMQSLGIL